MAVDLETLKKYQISWGFCYLKRFNMYYTYIIYSAIGDCYYKGYSEYPIERTKQHNAGKSKYGSRPKVGD